LITAAAEDAAATGTPTMSTCPARSVVVIVRIAAATHRVCSALRPAIAEMGAMSDDGDTGRLGDGAGVGGPDGVEAIAVVGAAPPDDDVPDGAVEPGTDG